MLHAQMAKSFEDLRGVGIQVTKLEKEVSGPGRTKSMLNFVRKLDMAPPPPPPPVRPQQESPLSLSFSQVDPEVLAELPEEIRREIEQSCRATTPAESSSSSAIKIQDESLEVTFSQLDPDVLAALPEDLRAEVRQEYSRPPKTETASSAAATAFDKMMNSKQESAVDSRNATPTHRKRGRPRKNSPRFIKKSNKGDKGEASAAKAHFSEQDAANHSPQVKRSRSPCTTETEEGSSTEQEVGEDRGSKGGASRELFAKESAGGESEVEAEPPEKRADLNGAREVDDVRALLRAWMASTGSPPKTTSRPSRGSSPTSWARATSRPSSGSSGSSTGRGPPPPKSGGRRAAGSSTRRRRASFPKKAVECTPGFESVTAEMSF